jgi:hypothetical protein
MKGGYGRTRWIPVLPELHRALMTYLGWLRKRLELSPAMPLFISREGDGKGNLRSLTRESARRIIHAAFAAAGVENDGRLGTHTLRKTWARKVYLNSGKDIMILPGRNPLVLRSQWYIAVDVSPRVAHFAAWPAPKYLLASKMSLAFPRHFAPIRGS